MKSVYCYVEAHAAWVGQFMSYQISTSRFLLHKEKLQLKMVCACMCFVTGKQDCGWYDLVDSIC